jgi:hypothetical protein
MDIYGDTGTGRTSLALTAPGPIGLAHTAEKIDGIVQKYTKKKKVIRTINFGGAYTGTPQEIGAKAAPVWNKMYALWTQAMGDWAKSLVMDTAYEGWEMIRLARFGTVKPQGRVDNMYGPVNAEWRSLFKPFRMQETTNVITIHTVKEEYVEKPSKTRGVTESVRTGRLVHAGMKEMRYMADVVVRMTRDPDYTVVATIEKGWFNPDVMGMEFRGDDVNFAFIMATITDTNEKEWR